jgi:hypothetical protein
MNRFSKGWIDLRPYYTKQILLDVLTSRMRLMYVNQIQTEYLFFCPFHTRNGKQEKTPSFKAHGKASFGWSYKCLGCGTAGNVFTFLKEFERWEFWEVIAYFKKYGYKGFPLRQHYQNPKQLCLEFPIDEYGNFIWVSGKMTQLGFV